MRLLIATRVKDEALYLLDWVAYHKMLGVCGLLVVSNDCSDHSTDLLQRLDQNGVVHHIDADNVPLSGRSIGRRAFDSNKCWEGLVDYTHLLSLDLDEFLCLPTPSVDSLSTVVDIESPHFIQWHNLASGMRLNYSPAFVLDRSVYRKLGNNGKVLMPVNRFGDYINSHSVMDTDGGYLTKRSLGVLGGHLESSVYIAHCVTKSAAEFAAREMRGRLSVSGRSHSGLSGDIDKYKYNILRFFELENGCIEKAVRFQERQRARFNSVRDELIGECDLRETLSRVENHYVSVFDNIAQRSFLYSVISSQKQRCPIDEQIAWAKGWMDINHSEGHADHDALIFLADCLKKKEKTEELATLIQSGVERFNSGILASYVGSDEDAKRLLAERYPEDSANQYEAARTCFADGRLDEARHFASKAVALKPCTTYRLLLAQIYTDMGKLDHAISEYESVQAVDEPSQATLHPLLKLYMRKKRFGIAMELAATLVHVYPRDEKGWYQLANLQFIRKQLRAAQKSGTKALDLRPNYPNATHLLAKIHAEAGEEAAALLCAFRAVYLRPENEKFVGTLSQIMGSVDSQVVKSCPKLASVGEWIQYEERAFKTRQSYVAYLKSMACRVNSDYTEGLRIAELATEDEPDNEILVAFCGEYRRVAFEVKSLFRSVRDDLGAAGVGTKRKVNGLGTFFVREGPVFQDEHGTTVYEKYSVLRSWSMPTVRTRRRVVLNGCELVVRENTPDLNVARNCLERGEFDWCRDLIGIRNETSGFIIDAGGYIGTAAIAFSRMYPDWRIVVLEPSPENYEVLVENVRTFPNIVPLNVALKARSDAAELRDRGTGEWGYTTVENPKDVSLCAHVQRVEGVTVEQIRKKYQIQTIDLLKLDIEGGEKEVLESSDSWLPGVRVLVAELHDRIVDGCREAFDKAVRRSGMTHWEWGGSGEKKVAVRDAP